MLGLITVLGTRHPPTADDSVPLGGWRYVLGLATLAFLFVSFMPRRSRFRSLAMFPFRHPSDPPVGGLTTYAAANYK